MSLLEVIKNSQHVLNGCFEPGLILTAFYVHAQSSFPTTFGMTCYQGSQFLHTDKIGSLEIT